MSITLTLADGSTRFVRHAKTGQVQSRRDREQYRAPYGTTWRTQGTGRRLPELVTVTVEVSGRTFDDASGELNAIITDARASERLETPLGSWLLDGLQSAIPQPIAAGYRLDVTWLAGGPRMFTGSYGFGSYGAGAYGGDNA